MFLISGKLSIFVTRMGKTITPNEINKILSISFYDKANDGSGFLFDELMMLYDKGLLINDMDIYQV